MGLCRENRENRSLLYRCDECRSSHVEIPDVRYHPKVRETITEELTGRGWMVNGGITVCPSCESKSKLWKAPRHAKAYRAAKLKVRLTQKMLARRKEAKPALDNFVSSFFKNLPKAAQS